MYGKCPWSQASPSLPDVLPSEGHQLVRSLSLRDQGSTLFCSRKRKVWDNAVNPTQWLQKPIELIKILSVYFSLSSSVAGVFVANLRISSSA